MALFKRQKNLESVQSAQEEATERGISNASGAQTEKVVHAPKEMLREWSGMVDFYAKLPHKVGYAYAEICMEQLFRIYNVFGEGIGRKSVAALSKMLASKIGDGEAVVRAGMNCFGLLLKMQQDEELGARIQKILDELSLIQVTDGKSYYTYPRRFTCGVAEVFSEDETIKDIREMAAIARRNSVHEKVPYLFFDKKLRDETLKIKQLLNDAAGAMERNEFVPYFLPKYDLETRRIVGAETLARWNHPQKGIIMPQVFLPMLEQNGNIMELDMYMLEEACKLIKTWTENEAMPVPLSVNIAPVNIYKNDFFERIMGVTKKYNVPPCLIELELSEEALFENSEYLTEPIAELKAEGFLLTIDNFGAKYTSLSSMKDMPVDLVKLDRNYLARMDTEKNVMILKHITQIAQELGIMMIAEGIEKDEQVAMLKNVGCNHGMGFLFAKPMALNEFEAMTL